MRDERIILWRMPRTAGTSLRRGLTDLGITHHRMPGHLADDSSSPGVTSVQADYLVCGHTTPAEVVRHGWFTKTEIHEAVNIFCVRNVWDRLVSLFSLLRTKGWNHPQLGQWRGSNDFATYVKWAISSRRETSYHPRNYQCQPASEWMLIDGRPVPFRCLGRFERLGEHWQAVCELFGVTGDMPRLNAAPHKPYRDYYTTELRFRVADFFAQEIDTFGWEF